MKKPQTQTPAQKARAEADRQKLLDRHRNELEARFHFSYDVGGALQSHGFRRDVVTTLLFAHVPAIERIFHAWWISEGESFDGPHKRGLAIDHAAKTIIQAHAECAIDVRR